MAGFHWLVYCDVRVWHTFVHVQLDVEGAAAPDTDAVCEPGKCWNFSAATQQQFFDSHNKRQVRKCTCCSISVLSACGASVATTSVCATRILCLPASEEK